MTSIGNNNVRRREEIALFPLTNSYVRAIDYESRQSICAFADLQVAIDAIQAVRVGGARAKGDPSGPSPKTMI